MEPTKEAEETPFRFLDLIPELRNAIYDLVYSHEETPLSLDLADLPLHLPNQALTLTGRQIRSETLVYCTSATITLWHPTNTFTLNLNRASELSYLDRERVTPPDRTTEIQNRVATLRRVEVVIDGAPLYILTSGDSPDFPFAFRMQLVRFPNIRCGRHAVDMLQMVLMEGRIGKWP